MGIEKIIAEAGGDFDRQIAGAICDIDNVASTATHTLTDGVTTIEEAQVAADRIALLKVRILQALRSVTDEVANFMQEEKDPAELTSLRALAANGEKVELGRRLWAMMQSVGVTRSIEVANDLGIPQLAVSSYIAGILAPSDYTLRLFYGFLVQKELDGGLGELLKFLGDKEHQGLGNCLCVMMEKAKVSREEMQSELQLGDEDMQALLDGTLLSVTAEMLRKAHALVVNKFSEERERPKF
jgi:hypothetical protein